MNEWMNEYRRAVPEVDDGLGSGLLCKSLWVRNSTSGSSLKVTDHILPEPWVLCRPGPARASGRAKQCDSPRLPNQPPRRLTPRQALRRRSDTRRPDAAPGAEGCDTLEGGPVLICLPICMWGVRDSEPSVTPHTHWAPLNLHSFGLAAAPGVSSSVPSHMANSWLKHPLGNRLLCGSAIPYSGLH